MEPNSTEVDQQQALTIPPTKPRLSSPDVTALLTPFHDRLLAFEAKHRHDGTTASAAGTAPSSPGRTKSKHGRGTAAEALIRALQASRNAFAATAHADIEGDSQVNSQDGVASGQHSPCKHASVCGTSDVSGLTVSQTAQSVIIMFEHVSRHTHVVKGRLPAHVTS